MDAGVEVFRALERLHFPSDVVIGACIGSIIGWAIRAKASATDPTVLTNGPEGVQGE